MNNIFVSSPSVKVYWAGWESTTSTLQQQGWQFSAEQELVFHRFRIAIKHPNFRIYGLSQFIPFDEYYEVYRNGNNPFRTVTPIVIQYMASRLDIVLHDNLENFQPVDMLPSFTIDHEKKSIEDFMIFRPIGNTKEIIIAEPKVPELLDIILKKQDPKQKEIREKKRKEWRKFVRGINEKGMRLEYEKMLDNRNNIVAQLITV